MKTIKIAIALMIAGSAHAQEPYAPVRHHNPVDIQIVNPKTHDRLPNYHHQGKTYVAGKPGKQYAIQICNHSSSRTLSVVSVDGVNVISGEDASPHQTGYVLNPHSCTDIKGWRKSMNQVAEFVFSDPKSSYAERTGRGNNTGIIGIATFLEKQPEFRPMEDTVAEAFSSNSVGGAPAPSARMMQKSDLGTGHGRRIHDRVQNTEFDKDINIPPIMKTIEYDTREGLVRRGIITEPKGPNPWPGQKFVPDPY